MQCVDNIYGVPGVDKWPMTSLPGDFEEKVSDGSSKLRFVGFDSKQQKKMLEMMPKKQAIEIENCEIKPSRRGEKMEILLKSDSRINEIKKKIEVADIDFEDDTPEEIQLDSLQSKFEYVKVTVRVKIHRVTEAETVRTGKRKQEVVVADKKSTAKVTLWEDQIGSLKQGESYCLEVFFVKEFGGEKYLSVGSESKIVSIENVEVLEISNTDKTIKDVAIMAVAQMNCYRACLRCNVRVEAADEGNGRCSRPDCRCCKGWSFAVNMLTLS